MRECLVEELIQGFFDGELEQEEMSAVAAHLSACATCSERAGEIEQEIALLTTALAADTAPSVPTDLLRERIYTAIAAEQIQTEKPEGSFFSRWQRFFAEALTAFTPQRAVGFASLTLVALLAFGALLVRSDSSSNEQLADLVFPVPTSTVAPIPLRSSNAPDPVDDIKDSKTPVKIAPRTVSVKYRRDERPATAAEQSASDLASLRLMPGEKSYLKTIVALKAQIEAQGDTALNPEVRLEYERNLNVVDQAIISTRTAAMSNPYDTDATSSLLLAYQSKVDLLSAVVNQTRSASGDR